MLASFTVNFIKPMPVCVHGHVHCTRSSWLPFVTELPPPLSFFYLCGYEQLFMIKSLN